MPSIVVGVDGSPPSLDALRWAQSIAGDSDVVRVVVGWTYLVDTGVPTDSVAFSTLPVDPMEQQAERTLADALAAVPAVA